MQKKKKKLKKINLPIKTENNISSFFKKFSMYWSHLSVVKQNQINSYIWY